MITCQVITEQIGSTFVVHVSGPVTADGGHKTVKDEVSKLFGQGAKKVVLEMGTTCEIDRKSIWTLIDLWSMGLDHEAQINIANPSAMARTSINGSTLESMVDVLPTVEEAINCFR